MSKRISSALLHKPPPAGKDPLENDGIQALSDENFEEALTKLGQAIELKPENADTRAWRAKAHVEAGKYEEALSDVEEALKRNPSKNIQAHAHYFQGEALWNLDKNEQALACFEKTRALYPDSPDYIFACGRVSLELELYEKALVDLNEAIEKYPDVRKAPVLVKMDELLAYKAQTLYHLNQIDDALDLMNQVIDLNAQVLKYHLLWFLIFVEVIARDGVLEKDDNIENIISKTYSRVLWYHLFWVQIFLEMIKKEGDDVGTDILQYLDTLGTHDKEKDLEYLNLEIDDRSLNQILYFLKMLERVDEENELERRIHYLRFRVLYQLQLYGEALETHRQASKKPNYQKWLRLAQIGPRLMGQLGSVNRELETMDRDLGTMSGRLENLSEHLETLARPEGKEPEDNGQKR